MKKVIVTFLILLTVIAASLYYLKTRNVENNTMDNLKSKIEEFSALNEEERVKIKKFINEKNFNDTEKIILFLQENNSLGYVILENDKIKMITYGNDINGNNVNQSYEQYKNYFFVYGVKPKKNNTELKMTIDAGDNFEDIEKTIPLDEGEYFLSVGELPKEIKNSRFFSENFKYN